MLYNTTLQEISSNINTGVEYEIALFYKLLLSVKTDEAAIVMNSVNTRYDADKVNAIISMTNIAPISFELSAMGLELYDVSFETQNDAVGPSDVVMNVIDKNGVMSKIGLSIKYSNTCTLNVTGRKFITDTQISSLKRLLPQYTNEYIAEMCQTYGAVENWFRKRKPSRTTDRYIDLIRDAVIANWPNVANKTKLLSVMFHNDSPIPFWVVTYENNGYNLKTIPETIDMSRADDVIVRKYETSSVAFYLDGRKIGHMQVKFNNGLVQKCKKKKPDVTFQGVDMAYGQPFSSWNFSVEK